MEVVGAAVSGSLALLADAGHVLTDAAGLLIALLAATLALRPASERRTWGYQRAEVLAATAQAAALLAVAVLVTVEAVRRLAAPPHVAVGGMAAFGVVALLGNAACLVVLVGGRGGQRAGLGVRAAALEVASDAAGSVAVLLAAAVIAATGWQRADPVVSVVLALVVLPRTLRLLRETTEVLLEATPRGLDLTAVREHLLALPHVESVHDLHASQITPGVPVLTAHVVVADSCFHDGHAAEVLDQLQACVAEHFTLSVEHSTFQLEPARHGGHEPTLHR